MDISEKMAAQVKFQEQYSANFLQNPTPEREQRTIAIVSIILGTIVLLGIVLVSYFVPNRVIPFICKNLLQKKALSVKIFLSIAVGVWDVIGSILLLIFLIGGIHSCMEYRKNSKNSEKKSEEQESEGKNIVDMFEAKSLNETIEESFQNSASSEDVDVVEQEQIHRDEDGMESPSNILARLLKRDEARRKERRNGF